MDDMTKDFGELVRAAREALGLDQAQVARQLDVGQQTVSNWERGKSRPRRAMAPRIAQVLSVDVQKILDALAVGRTGVTEMTMPVRPLLTELPLGMLPEDVFERFSTDLASLLYPHPDVVHGYGSRGHKQYGIDIEVHHLEGLPTGIQCKRAQEFGPADVKAAVDALTMEVRECIIFLSRKTASTDARKEIAKHPSWQLLDALDISRKIRNLPDQTAAIILVETYFPGYRKDFLGVDKPSPWESVDSFFRPAGGNPFFNHDWQLVGRTRELEALSSFFYRSPARVAIVVGPGGMGKSRIIRQFGLDMAEPTARATALFAAADTAVEPAQFEQLPAFGHLAVVIEDAHTRPDSAGIVKGVLRRNPEAKAVISVRPYALAELQSDLRRAGIYPDDCAVIALDELSVADAQALALQALNDATPPGFTQWLGSVAPDCPLVIVVAAGLIRRGLLDGARLPGSVRMRAEVMEAFQDAMTAGADAGDSDLRREVLQAVAALQPFRIGDDHFRSAASALTGRAFDQIMPYIKALEAAQILQRRGASFRVVPDLLGDAVLASACADAETGIRTGYLDRAFRAADGAALAHLFINGCRVDWQIRQSQSPGPSFVDPLWELVKDQFTRAGIDERVDLLQLLNKVAAFQPGHALALARWALDNPLEEPGSVRLQRLGFGYQRVRNEIAKLLEYAAYNLPYLGDSAGMLWEIAKTDNRKTNQFPDHPMRVLSRLIGYAPTTPIAYQEQLLAVVSGWFQGLDSADALYSPFDVLDVLLATEAVVQSSDGLSLTMRSYPVALDAVRGLRDKVVELAFAELVSSDVRRAVRAARTIGAAIAGPFPAFNRVPDQEEKDRWTPIFTETISRVTSVAEASKLDPVVVIAIREALRWHYQHSSSETRVAAQMAWRTLPDSIEYRFALIVHDYWGTLLDGGEEPGYRQEAQNALVASVVIEAIEAWPGNELLHQLEQILVNERLAFGKEPALASPVMWQISEEVPSIGNELCLHVIRDPDSVLQALIPAALGRLLQASPSDGSARIQDLMATGNVELARNVANALGWGRGQRAFLFASEAALLRSLARHDDVIVRRHTVFAARAISSVDPSLARELVTTVRFDDSAALADDVAAAFGPQGYVQWGTLSVSEADSVVDQLADCTSIDEYNIVVLLVEISRTAPESAADFLIGRIERWERAASPLDYTPLPHTWHRMPVFTSDRRYGDRLRRVLKWMADSADDARRRIAGGELFALMAGDFGEEPLAVLREALSSGDVQQVKIVGAILSQAPRNLLWEQVDFVTLALRSADLYGEEAVQRVGGGLHAAAFKGMRSGVPMEPFDWDTEQRDKSAEILGALQPGSVEYKFYESLVESAKRGIAWKADIDETLISRRGW